MTSRMTTNIHQRDTRGICNDMNNQDAFVRDLHVIVGVVGNPGSAGSVRTLYAQYPEMFDSALAEFDEISRECLKGHAIRAL